eukprot:GHVU01105760.1.p1 GENE.GHVU01105760.1~~GHVU01105760.1.p1  ORF type:complete len:149 (+),score=3.82 GHVU01105760.1:182-628(+)
MGCNHHSYVLCHCIHTCRLGRDQLRANGPCRSNPGRSPVFSAIVARVFVDDDHADTAFDSLHEVEVHTLRMLSNMFLESIRQEVVLAFASMLDRLSDLADIVVAVGKAFEALKRTLHVSLCSDDMTCIIDLLLLQGMVSCPQVLSHHS